MEYKIEKNIPIPKATKKRLYPFEKMQVSDSFYADININHATALARYWSKKLGTAYTARGEGNGARIWRIR